MSGFVTFPLTQVKYHSTEFIFTSIPFVLTNHENSNPSLAVWEGETWSRSREFESKRHIKDESFSYLFVLRDRTEQ